MSKLDELIQEHCPNGVEFKPIKEVYQRLKGTPITAAKMKEIEKPDGDIRILAGGKTVIEAYEEDIPKANIIRVPAVLVQSRGVIDAIYYERPEVNKSPFEALSEQELLDKLAKSCEHAEQGLFQEASTVSAEMRKKYGV